MEVSKTVLMSPKRGDIYKNWQLLAEGEQQGLFECFNIFYDDLYRFGLSLYKNPELVKEGIHNLFLELWKIKHKLADVQNVQQYTLTIYKRILYKTYQQFSEETQTCDLIADIEVESSHIEPSYESILIASQHDEHMKKRLQKALNQLSPRQKEIIRLRYFDTVAFKDIADQTGLTERTVYNTLHNAIKILRDVICVTVVFRMFGDGK
ncbi:RNA polymerase sigma-70 factor, ECF subfamily [Mucilaginibacter pineti]|uniref:RNA polymerase sigma-70 factor, ECF subfamily n=2 Tax=Mucilaginibacter pineti TaxID=1391627 RepID=A0A1G7LSK1_9SPHI|nr:RNA polymerase sigma-70 factor, ECF subfamily [Mucilaginibacter pineti]